jgi:DNA modification methylase
MLPDPTRVDELRLELVPLSDLRPYHRNPRRGNVAEIARSLNRTGQYRPIVANVGTHTGRPGEVLAGNHTLAAAGQLRWAAIWATWVDVDEDTAARIVAADNRTADLGSYDDNELLGLLQQVAASTAGLDGTGYDDADLLALLERTAPRPARNGDPDDIPDEPAEPISRLGDVWQLGEHRIMCGDSTDPAHVAWLVGDTKAQLLHSDPPYGMGKAADGVIGDNTYGAELDAFQLRWWDTWRPHLDDNASAYCWGNAPDLWRLWYAAGLGARERFELRNEIVWDKGAIPGMASDLLTQYPTASERCLFWQFGQQFLGNVNTADFPETWAPLLDYLAGQAEAAGLKSKALPKLVGVQMFSHWFSRSQYTLIPAHHYATLAEAFPGYFTRPWRELKAQWDRVKGGPGSEVQGARSYFDNGHDTMTDVWRYPRVLGEERFGHATPKPVAMVARAIVSSCPPGGLVLEPFAGTGSTLIAADDCGRVCYTMELSPVYVDTTVRRWQLRTGGTPYRNGVPTSLAD